MKSKRKCICCTVSIEWHFLMKSLFSSQQCMPLMWSFSLQKKTCKKWMYAWVSLRSWNCATWCSNRHNYSVCFLIEKWSSNRKVVFNCKLFIYERLFWGARTVLQHVRLPLAMLTPHSNVWSCAWGRQWLRPGPGRALSCCLSLSLCPLNKVFFFFFNKDFCNISFGFWILEVTSCSRVFYTHCVAE